MAVIQNVAVLDVGSSKVTVLIGQRGANNTIQIKGIGECEYSGFADGQWLNKDKLPSAISYALTQAEEASGLKVKSIYVGVPGEFCIVECKETSIGFNKRHRVTDVDVDKLYANCTFEKYENLYEVINVQPVYFTLDSDRRLMVPVGQYSLSLSGMLSYVLADKNFIQLFDSILSEIGITEIDYVCSPLAEYLLLFPEKKRDSGVILADVGHITTSVCIAKGDGLLDLKSFSKGGGHIAADLTMALEMPYKQAETLKRKVIVSLEATEKDVYEIVVGDSVKPFPAKFVNEVVSARIQMIAKAIAKCISVSNHKLPDYAPVYLTGGGIAYMHGVKDILSSVLGRPVEIVVPPMPQVGYPDKSSGWGLLDMVLNNVTPEKENFIAKLINKIKNQ